MRLLLTVSALVLAVLAAVAVSLAVFYVGYWRGYDAGFDAKTLYQETRRKDEAREAREAIAKVSEDAVIAGARTRINRLAPHFKEPDRSRFLKRSEALIKEKDRGKQYRGFNDLLYEVETVDRSYGTAEKKTSKE